MKDSTADSIAIGCLALLTGSSCIAYEMGYIPASLVWVLILGLSTVYWLRRTGTGCRFTREFSRRRRRSWQTLLGRNTDEENRLVAQIVRASRSVRDRKLKLVQEMWRGRYLRDVTIVDYRHIQDAFDDWTMMDSPVPLRAIDDHTFIWDKVSMGPDELDWLMENGYLLEGLSVISSTSTNEHDE